MFRRNPILPALMGLLLVIALVVAHSPASASAPGVAAVPSDETVDLLIFLASMAGLGVLSLWTWRRHQLRDRRARRVNRSRTQTD